MGGCPTPSWTGDSLAFHFVLPFGLLGFFGKILHIVQLAIWTDDMWTECKFVPSWLFVSFFCGVFEVFFFFEKGEVFCSHVFFWEENSDF